ncbi:hypothetical protein HUU05_11380, partial [candidate division KSB1 bacterium]|nr:hypothetical protein [candidate division KSB1 bacterium]
ELKKQEGKQFAVDGVPKALPALQRAARLQQKAGAPAMSWEQLQATLYEMEGKMESNHRHDQISSDETLHQLYGDALFALVAFGRGLELNAEDALREACDRFMHASRTAEGNGVVE